MKSYNKPYTVSYFCLSTVSNAWESHTRDFRFNQEGGGDSIVCHYFPVTDSSGLSRMATTSIRNSRKTKIGHRVRFDALLQLFKGKGDISNSVSNPYKLL